MASPQKEEGFTSIANELVEEFAKINLSPYEWRTLWVLWRKTWGWHKKEDKISVTQFQKLTGLKRQHQGRALKSLKGKNIITSGGDSFIHNYKFQKDYTQWKTVTSRGNRRKTVTSGGNRVLPLKVTKPLPVEVPTKEKRNYTKEITEFFAYYLLKTQKDFKLTEDKRKLIKNRFAEGYTLEQLKLAVDSFIQDPWPERKKHLNLIYCIGKQYGKPDNLEKWLNFNQSNRPNVKYD